MDVETKEAIEILRGFVQKLVEDFYEYDKRAASSADVLREEVRKSHDAALKRADVYYNRLDTQNSDALELLRVEVRNSHVGEVAKLREDLTALIAVATSLARDMQRLIDDHEALSARVLGSRRN